MHDFAAYAWFLKVWGDYVRPFLIENLQEILVAAIIVLLALNVAQAYRRLALWYHNKRRRGLFEMPAIDKFGPNRKEREAFVKRMVGDRITDLLEEEFFKDTLTRDEVNFWYRRFANLFSMEDLLPRCEKILKRRIKDRLDNKAEAFKPIPFPDKEENTPVEEVRNPLQRFFNKRAA